MTPASPFRDAPSCPGGDFPWKKYYWRRPRVRREFEGDYWGEVLDPDGRKRNLLEEREQKIRDQQAEIRFVNGLSPGRVLDVGCGPGVTLSAIDPAWEKHGTEVSRLAAELAGDAAKVFHGDLHEARYEAASFDVVMLIHVLRYIDDPAACIAEVLRILKPGGKLVLAEADYDSGCARRFESKYRLLHDQGIINLFTSFSLIRLLEDYGFGILRIEYPFFETQWFNRESLERLFNVNTMSPPFYGNFITAYATKGTE